MLEHLGVSKGCLDETQPSLSSLPVSEAPATVLRDEAPWCLDLEASFNSPGQFPHPERACGRYLSRAEDCCSSSSSPFPFGHPCLCELPLSISALLPVDQKLFQPPCWEIPKPHANTRVRVTAKTLLSQVFAPNESLLAPRSNLDTTFWVTPWQWLSGAALPSPESPL